MRIDSHMQFWDVARFDYPRVPEAIRRTTLPPLADSILRRNRFDGAIAVQSLDDEAETRWLLELAREHEIVAGVVGWADLADPGLPHRLDAWQRDPKFLGVRAAPHGAGVKELARRGLPLDVRSAQEALRAAGVAPELTMVLDHLGNPRLAGDGGPWAREMEALGAIPGVYVKISGMIEPAWTAELLRPFVHHALRVFGPERCLFGSDWPMCLAAGNWKHALAAFTQAIGAQPQEIREKLLGGNAARAYRLAATSSGC